MIHLLNLLIGIGWGGFALATLWGWFITPLGVPAVVWWQAAGVMVAYMALTGGAGAYAKITGMRALNISKDDEPGFDLCVSIIVPAICLAVGFTLKTLGPIVERAL